jgi:L-threonylcarbamoyladenylate synthase
VPLETLRTLLPELAFVPRYVQEGQAASAPGGLLKHYSPDAPLTLVEGASDAIHAYFWQQAHQYQRAGTTLGLLVADDDLAAISGIPAHVIALGPLADLEQVAAALFAGLRNLDALQPAAILARSFGQHGLGLAIGDRLIRAAEGRLISLPAHLAQ